MVGREGSHVNRLLEQHSRSSIEGREGREVRRLLSQNRVLRMVVSRDGKEESRLAPQDKNCRVEGRGECG